MLFTFLAFNVKVKIRYMCIYSSPKSVSIRNSGAMDLARGLWPGAMA